MRFGHYWPKDPASEKIEHLRPYPIGIGPLFCSMPVLKFEPFSVGGTDGSGKDTPEARARAVQRVWDSAMGGVCGTVRHLP